MAEGYDAICKRAALISRKAFLMQCLTAIHDAVKKPSLEEIHAEVYLSSTDKHEETFTKISEEIFNINEKLDKKDMISTADLDEIGMLITSIRTYCLIARKKYSKSVSPQSSSVLRLDREKFSKRQHYQQRESFQHKERPSYRHESAPHTKKTLLVNSSKSSLSCLCCKGDHPLYRCQELLSMPVTKRQDKVREIGGCISCLYKHQGRPCTSKYACKLCGSKSHNTILHTEPSS